MDSCATKDGAMAVRQQRVSTRSTRRAKSKSNTPKRLIDLLTTNKAGKKISVGDGVAELFKEHSREIMTYNHYFLNKDKNAKPDKVFCFDWNRVTLDEGDYYNASRVDGNKREGQYVLAQAPFNKQTTRDFRRLILQVKPDAIVYLENHEAKERELVFSKENKIQFSEDTKTDSYEQYTMTVDSVKTKAFVMKGWSVDKEIPKSIIDVVDKVRKVISWDNAGALLIVCADGATRSGVYCAIDIEMDRLNTKGKSKMQDTVKTLRYQRSNTFDTFEMFDALLTVEMELCKRYPDK